MGNKCFIWTVFILCHASIFGQMSTTETHTRYLVFINGNRGPKANHETTDNRLHEKDPTGYWYSIDDTIIKRFPGVTALYFDGHHPVSSSQHRTNVNFAKAYFFSRFCFISKRSRWVFNKKPNPEGFQLRVVNGQIAGENLINYLKEKGIPLNQVKIDFVCHSMGYAYALGMFDALKSNVSFGKLLILSPEHASAQARDWQYFEEVWQYGARADDKESDAICYQDGIAPQVAVPGIDSLDPSKGGRVYIPSDWPKKKKGFIKSHHLFYYQWFHEIKPGDRGYFKL
ncbi:MAG: hypothetical protein ACO29U_01070 [Crocinitomicaceae bacterium]|jgi:hypothetical protein